MADQYVPIDLAKPPGSRFPDVVNAEIAEVAPSTVDPGSITTSKLGAEAVTTPKLADAAVTTPKLANSAVETAKLADSAVTTDKLGPNAVTPAKAGTGMVTAVDAGGTARALKVQTMSTAAFAGVTPDPNTWYVLT